MSVTVVDDCSRQHDGVACDVTMCVRSESVVTTTKHDGVACDVITGVRSVSVVTTAANTTVWLVTSLRVLLRSVTVMTTPEANMTVWPVTSLYFGSMSVVMGLGCSQQEIGLAALTSYWSV